MVPRESRVVMLTGQDSDRPSVDTPGWGAEQEPEHEDVGTDGAESPPSLATNTVWSLAAEGFRLVGSLVTFVILTRLYEPSEFGILVATISLFGFVFPHASVGAGWLVMKRVASEGWSPEEAMARATGMALTGGVVAVAGLMLLRPLILPQVSAAMFFGLAISELFLVGMVEITLFAAQATERLIVKAATWTTYGMGRAAAALAILVLVDDPDLGVWIVANAMVGVLVLLMAQTMTLGRVVAPVRPVWADVRLGLPYSLGFGSDRLRDVADTVALVRLDYEADAGLYSAARRLVNVAQAPIIASLHAVNARIWRAGGRSAADARAVAVRSTAVGAAYGSVVGVGILLGGSVAASFLGDSYEETGAVLRWMSIVPLLLALETFAAMALTASGFHTHRVVWTLVSGVVNVGLNLWLIPDHGWRGAAGATIASSVLYVVALWLTLNWASQERVTRGSQDDGAQEHETANGATQ